MITDPLLTGCPGVRHGFFERRGGTSQGLYASLNVGLGSSDDRRCVTANRALVARALDLEPARLVTLYQVHSADVVIVRDGTEGATKADGMVTGELPVLEGEAAVAYGSDLLAPARVLGEQGKKLDGRLEIVGGVFEGAFVGQEKMQTIAAIPPIETLYAQFLTVIRSPVQGFASVLGQVAEKK